MVLLGFTAGIAAAQDYEGPTVLSRSGGGIRPYGERIGQDAKLRLYADVSSVYDSGFHPVSVTSAGTLVSTAGDVGFQANIGVYGTKRWRRSSLGLDFNSSYIDYLKNTYFNGSSDFVGLEYGNQLDRKNLLTGTVSAGTSNSVFGAGSGLLGSPLGNVLPSSDVFDARVYFISGGMGISHQQTARLGFELRADAFQVERHSSSLVSARGYSPKAAITYRINRRTTIGGTYNFFHYDFPRAFGETNIHAAMALYGYEINRMWRVEVQGGAFVADSAGARVVNVDPVVRALLGISSVTEAFSRVVLLPNAQFRLAGKTKNSQFGMGMYRGPAAGNGVTLASSQQTGFADYGYVFSKNLTLSASFGLSQASSLSDTTGRFSMYYTNTGLTYHTGRNLVMHLNGNYRFSAVKSLSANNVDAFRVTLGFGWTGTEQELLRH